MYHVGKDSFWVVVESEVTTTLLLQLEQYWPPLLCFTIIFIQPGEVWQRGNRPRKHQQEGATGLLCSNCSGYKSNFCGTNLKKKKKNNGRFITSLCRCEPTLHLLFLNRTNVFVSISSVYAPDSSKSCSYLWSFIFSHYFINSEKHLDILTNILVRLVPEARN